MFPRGVAKISNLETLLVNVKEKTSEYKQLLEDGRGYLEQADTYKTHSLPKSDGMAYAWILMTRAMNNAAFVDQNIYTWEEKLQEEINKLPPISPTPQHLEALETYAKLHELHPDVSRLWQYADEFKKKIGSLMNMQLTGEQLADIVKKIEDIPPASQGFKR